MIAVMVAGLPTAGNVYNFAHKFNTGLPMARNTVAATTIISPIVIAVLALAMSA
jgi:predicted permease